MLKYHFVRVISIIQLQFLQNLSKVKEIWAKIHELITFALTSLEDRVTPLLLLYTKERKKKINLDCSLYFIVNREYTE